MHGQNHIKKVSHTSSKCLPTFTTVCYVGSYCTHATHLRSIHVTSSSTVRSSTKISVSKLSCCRSQWPRGLRRRSTATRLLRSLVLIPSEAWMFVCCECCVLSGRGLCDERITCPEESYRLWCVVVCDQETTKILVNEEAKRPTRGLWRQKKKNLAVPGGCLFVGTAGYYPYEGIDFFLL